MILSLLMLLFLALQTLCFAPAAQAAPPEVENPHAHHHQAHPGESQPPSPPAAGACCPSMHASPLLAGVGQPLLGQALELAVLPVPFEPLPLPWVASHPRPSFQVAAGPPLLDRIPRLRL